jgi:hypothetical protein
VEPTGPSDRYEEVSALASSPDVRERVGVTCEACGSLLGHIVNYGTTDQVYVTLPCPCGGSSPSIRVATFYKPEADGIIADGAFAAEIERAIEVARHR